MTEQVPLGTSEIKKPRTITPERARELRAKLPEMMPKIDALLAEFPASFGQKGGAR